jgi:hypothetical protein
MLTSLVIFKSAERAAMVADVRLDNAQLAGEMIILPNPSQEPP